MADVFDLVHADTTLSRGNRRAVLSGLRTVSKSLRIPLGELPVSLDKLRTRMNGFAPASIGMSEGRWRNCLWCTRRALALVGIIKTPARAMTPFAPAWAALFKPITEKHARIALCRFARYCGDRGVTPDEVTDEVLDSFLATMTNDSLIKRPRIVHQTTIRVWNRMAGTAQGWPGLRLRAPSYSRTYTLPWDRYPVSLGEEVTAYLTRLSGRNILDDLDIRPLRPASLRTRDFQLRAYLAACVHSGIDPQTLGSLRAALQLETVKAGLRFFLDRGSNHPTKQAHETAGLLLSIARHWLQLDDQALTVLRKLVAKLKPKTQGLAPKNRTRLRQFDDPKNVDKILGLPQHLVTLANRIKHPTYAEALLVQSALAIEILLMVPLRRGNLARLKTDEHVIRSGKGIVHLSIPEEEVKNGMPIDTVLPASLGLLLDLYLETYRPLLLTEPCPYLFPGRGNRAKDAAGFGLQISECIKAHTGLLMNPHLFRHFAGKLFLAENPGGIGVVRLLHGHKSIETTTRYYVGLESQAAFKHYDAHVLNVREQSGTTTAAPKKRTRS
jgi:integrase